MTYTDREDLREDVIALDVEHVRKILFLFMLRLTPEAIFIFKKVRFPGAQNMLTKG